MTTSGVLVLDKPSGPTSHDIVARVRKKLGTREVGHAGTLDPMATGVLVLGIGEGTKLVPFLTAHDKTYEGTILLGIETDTLDAQGKETRRAPVPPDLALEEAIAIERARREQIPPAFSAIHSDGERAHERARRGEEVVLAAREVEVRALDARLDRKSVHVTLTVSKGYYVRSLARDLASALGTVGHLTHLRRTRSGPFDLGDACTLDGELRLLSLADAASRACGAITLTEKGTSDARNGRPVSPSDMSAEEIGPRAWLSSDGSLIAIGEMREGVGRVIRGFQA